MGVPTNVVHWYIQMKRVVCIGKLREVKHLSTSRKRNQNEIPQVAASERGRVQTLLMYKSTDVVSGVFWIHYL